MASSLIMDLKLGDRIIVKVNGTDEVGTIRFLGNLKTTKDQAGESWHHWCGVELDNPVGKHDGLMGKERLFKCRPSHGFFLKTKVLGPPFTLVDVEESADGGGPTSKAAEQNQSETLEEELKDKNRCSRCKVLEEQLNQLRLDVGMQNSKNEVKHANLMQEHQDLAALCKSLKEKLLANEKDLEHKEKKETPSA